MLVDIYNNNITNYVLIYIYILYGIIYYRQYKCIGIIDLIDVYYLCFVPVLRRLGGRG